MIEIAVCDEEKLVREDLRQRILQQEPSCRVTCFSSGRELLESGQSVDLVLLDVGEETNGIETAKELKKRFDAVLIFVTALKEHVFEAFDVGVFHYLLKPVDGEKFDEVLKKALAEIVREKGREPLLIKVGSTRHCVPLDDIIYAENNGRKIILHTRSRKLEFYGKMQELQERLGGEFFRCHRGYLVHLTEVTGYDSATIYLKDGTKVFLAKSKYAAFVTAYMAYMKTIG